MKVAAVLLAAGLSSRFGADKLAAMLDAIPLGHHAARTLMNLDLKARIVVTGGAGLAWPAEFLAIRNPEPERGLSHSIRLGVGAARKAGMDAVLIGLADMPFVSIAHFRCLLDGLSGPDSILASSTGGRRMPPAVFGSSWFDALDALKGEMGARSLLAHAVMVEASRRELRDIDYPGDLVDRHT
ncbi:nucleotidyltransferase family protein [Sphingobium sp. H39-3-25]|uniref:nucleotidyltransferase family protein n=1 Tax=Sphingobium arseniciresistens TaxID=3030834 RepID=UPI0023BA0CF7|nr:nucleotidyltransferase family protein [Sphingobium arseniciresistens]